MDVSDEYLERVLNVCERELNSGVLPVGGQHFGAILSALRELRVLRARHKEAVGLLREIRPQVDMVRGTWFDRTDAFLAQESEP